MGPFREFRFLAIAGAALMAAGWFTPVRAQDQDDLKRGVARISLIDNEVSVRRGDSGEWVAAVVNAPLLSDDRISTGPNSRAEVEFDASNVLRIGGNAEVRLVQLEYGRYQLEIARGTATWRVLRDTDANIEVDTPSVSVRPAKIGAYRISVNEAGESQITARAGDVEVFTPRGSQWVTAGQTMLARGTQADPEFQIVAAIAPDDWDRWNESRDQSQLQSRSYQYVGQGVYGAEDLDRYGSWDNVEPYGYSWHPTGVAADWAPYESGRWAWEDWYGWTWVSYDPWGWAPYHYGRWFHHARYGWCWYPGVIGVRHYWSPALVAWFGWGGGSGFGFGFGNVGWVPLAPYEVFHPWWGRGYYGRGFGRNINITNVNITNVYRNARVPGGVMGLRGGDFASGRFHNVQRVSGDQIRSAGLVRGQMPIAPGNQHLRFSDRQTAFQPRTNENMRFFRQQQPSAAPRMSFAQQRGVEQPRRTFGGGNTPSVRGQEGFRGGQAPAAAAAPRVNENGGAGSWRRFGESGGRQNAGPQNVSPRNDVQNWGGSQNPAVQNTHPQQTPQMERGQTPNQNRKK
ncbi:MAG TPA: FecR family protein [Bryobacteraceae bacterium]